MSTAALIVAMVGAFASSSAPLVPGRVLVLDVKSTSVPADQIAALTQLLTVELAKQSKRDVVNVREVARLAGLEADRQDAGCTQTSCLGEIAGAYGAELVVFGEESTLGDTHVFALQLFDSKRGVALGRASFTVDDIAKVPAQVPDAAAALLAGNAAAPPPPPPSSSSAGTATEAPASARADDASPVAAIVGYSVAGVVGVAGGVCFLAGAVVLTTPTDPDQGPLGFALLGGGLAGVAAAGAVGVIVFLATSGSP